MRALLLLTCTWAVVFSAAGAEPNPYCVAGADWRPGGKMEALGLPGGIDDWEGSLAYRWGQFDVYNICCMTNPYYRCHLFHAYEVDTDSIKDPAATEAWILANPGKVYLIGNEPNNFDLSAGDGMTQDQYARMFHCYHTFIKALDPTAKIATAGLYSSASTDSLASTTAWWDACLAEYRTQFGEEMPVDIWNNHCYCFVGSLDPDRIVAEFFVPFREYVNTVSGGIYADCEVWNTEFGVGVWSTPLHADYVAEFMQRLCPRLEASGSVDRWFWYRAAWSNDGWNDISLLGPDGQPTTQGQAYAALAQGYPNEIPPPPAAPPEPPARVESDFDMGTDPWRPMAGDWYLDEGAYRDPLNLKGWGQRAHLPYWYDDVRIECDVRINDSDEPERWAGVRLRHGTIWEGGIGGYLTYLRRNGELGLHVPPEGTVASVTGVVADTSVYHRLSVSIVGHHIEVRVDGELIITWDDPEERVDAGYVAIEAGKSDASFDNATVVSLSHKTASGHYRVGWNLTSVPVTPLEGEGTLVFRDLWELGNTITFNLYKYDPAWGYRVYPQYFIDVESSVGYWLRLTIAPPDTVVGVAGEPADGDVAIPLGDGWNLIGHPHMEATPLADCTIDDGATSYSMAEAISAGLVDMPVYYYAGLGYKTVAPAGGDDDSLRPWCGYWLLAGQPGLSLVVP